MSQSAAAFVGSIPEQYDRGLGPIMFVDTADAMARRVAAGVPARVLETAAGTGFVTRRLRDLLPAEVQIVATDLNPPMLDYAKAKFAAGEAVTIQPADATDLPFEDKSFDAVVCQFGVMFFPDKAKGYREALRVLKPGGRYHFSVWDAHRFNPFGRIANETVRAMMPDNPPRFYEVPFGYAALDPIKAALAEAGFTDLKIHVLSLTKTVADIGRLAHAAVFGNPMIAEVQAQGVDPAAVVEAIAAALTAELAGGPMPLQAVLFDAGRP